MDVLRKAGMRIPQDVAVVGFDGIEEGSTVTPPLTTVVQPLGELGAAAVDSLLTLMETGTAKDLALACAPLVRQSCGCAPRRSYDAGRAGVPAEATAAQRAAVRELIACASSPDPDCFISRLNTALAETILAGGQPGVWRDYLFVVRSAAPVEEGLFQFALVIVGEAESRLQAARRVAAEERLATLRAISSSLAGAFDLPLMLSRLETGLQRLGIGGCYLALFEAGGQGWSRLVMVPRGSPGSAAPGLPARGMRFRTRTSCLRGWMRLGGTRCGCWSPWSFRPSPWDSSSFPSACPSPRCTTPCASRCPAP